MHTVKSQLKTRRGEKMDFTQILRKFLSKRWHEWHFYFNQTKWCKREQVHHFHYMTYIAQTRPMNTNWRQKLGHA